MSDVPCDGSADCKAAEHILGCFAGPPEPRSDVEALEILTEYAFTAAMPVKRRLQEVRDARDRLARLSERVEQLEAEAARLRGEVAVRDAQVKQLERDLLREQQLALHLDKRLDLGEAEREQLERERDVLRTATGLVPTDLRMRAEAEQERLREALRPMPEHLESAVEWMEQIERDGSEPMSVAATTVLCHVRVLLEDIRALAPPDAAPKEGQ